MLRTTLVSIVKDEFEYDASAVATSQPSRPIIDIFTADVPNFSKYKLAKAYIKWTRINDSNSLTSDERKHWEELIKAINKALK